MNDIKRPRRSAASGYARGEETRLRIIQAAIELFGEAGFEGASTRDIAQRAGVNAPALLYYFESKEGLYRTCAEYLADETLKVFEPVAKQAREDLDAGAPPDKLIEAFLAIQAAIADKMFAAPHKIDTRLFFAREQAGHEPSIASEVLQRRLRQPLNELCAAILARLTGRAADDPLTLARVLSLHGQLMVFHIARRSTLSLFGWKEIDKKNAALIKATVREQSKLLMESWVACADSDAKKQ